MDVKRPAETVRCAICGKTGRQIVGSNLWKMCNTCFTAWCEECHRTKLGSPSFCTNHDKWGNWLTADSDGFGDMTFRER